MKRITLTLLALMLVLTSVFSIVSCDNGSGDNMVDITNDGEKIEAEGLWKNATYLENTTVGNGAKTVKFTVEIEDKGIEITLKTDKATLGEAMYEHKLINDPSFFNVLNGIEASWEKDQAYWAFYEGETLMSHGANDEKIDGGESYRFVYTK